MRLFRKHRLALMVVAALLTASGFAGVVIASQQSTPPTLPPFPTPPSSPPPPTETPFRPTATPRPTLTPVPRLTPTPRPTLVLPTATPLTSATIPPDTVLDRYDLFDFDRLPRVDTSAWVAYTGPSGRLSLRAPADWIVNVRPLVREGGEVFGEAISVRRPGIVGNEAATSAGWAMVDVYLRSFALPPSQGSDELIRVVPRDLDGESPDGRYEIMQVTQSGRSLQFPEWRGRLAYYGMGSKGESHVNAYGSVHFETTAEIVATVEAILGSVRVPVFVP